MTSNHTNDAQAPATRAELIKITLAVISPVYACNNVCFQILQLLSYKFFESLGITCTLVAYASATL